MTLLNDPIFNALSQPAARVGPRGILLEFNRAWLAQRPWGITEPGSQLGDRCPRLDPLGEAVGQINRLPLTLDVQESLPDGDDAPPRHWHITLTAIDQTTALLMADDVSDARATSDRLEAVIQEQPELICRFTPDTTLTFVNQAYCTFFGKTPEQMVGHHFLEFLPPGQQTRIQKRLAGLTPEQFSNDYEIPVVRPDGSDGWHIWSDRAFFDHRGRVVEYQSVGRDITEQKRIAAELKSRRQETQLILDSIPALVWFKDHQGNILRLNRRAADLVGLPPEEIEGRHTSEFFPEHADQYQLDDDAVFASGAARLGIIEPVVDGTGRSRWYRTDKVPLKVEGKSFDRLLALSIDVTDLIRAEERIRDSEARFRSLFERVPAAVFEHDLSGPAALVEELKAAGITDEHAEQYLIQHPEMVHDANRRTQIRGLNQALRDLFEADDNSQVIDAFRRGKLGNSMVIGRRKILALWHGTPSVEFKMTGYTMSGNPLDLLFRMDLPRDINGQIDPSRALISLTDLTERTRRIFDEARVQQAADERRNLGHELHDTLGQQLTGLRMLAATLHRRMAARRVPEAGDVAELGELIQEANVEVRRLISGLTPESITAKDLTTALNALRQNLERTHGITAFLHAAPPPDRLTDEQANHLLMIAGEATHNAAKHGNPTNIRISLIPHDGDLVLEIIDDGQGLLAADAAKKSVHPRDPRQFSRDHPDSSSGAVPMSGRGMHIMRYRARQIGATISFTSPQGEGTRVQCVLPSEAGHPFPPRAQPTPPRPPRGPT